MADAVERALRVSRPEDEVVERAEWLPLGTYADGTTRLAWPGLVKRFADTVKRGVDGEELGPEDALTFGSAMMPTTRFATPRTVSLGGRSPYARIPGTPETFKLPDGTVVDTKPIAGIVDAARDYAKRSGIRHEMPREFPKYDKDRARRVAAAFDAADHTPNAPETRRSAEALARETLGQYQALERQGYRFEFMDPDGKGGYVDPYAASPALGYRDLKDNKRLRIFPTEGGFGSTDDVAGNPMLQTVPGVTFGEKPVVMNDLFRAVHDAYGHFGYGNPFFRAPGEERAWNLHAGMFSPEARKLMTTETRGQNSWVNYGPHGETNRSASGADTVYAPQKTTVLPDWVMTDGRAAPQRLPYIAPPGLGSLYPVMPVDEE